MAAKMSKEEAAVRKALAAVEADTGVQQAQAIIGGTPFGQAQAAAIPTVPAPTAADKLNYEDARNAVSQLSPDWQERLGKAYAALDNQQQKVIDQAGALGYDVNTTTGVLTPKASGAGNGAGNGAGDGAGGNKDAVIDKDTRDAFAIIKGVFTQYGLGSLGATIETLMREGYGPEEATLALKTDPKYNTAYIKRFKGNETRRAAGLNVLDESTYLTLEDDYTKTLKAYGLESYFGIDTDTKQSAIADVIGADISAIEFTDRVSTAVDRVKMADPATKKAFQDFYGIGETELVKYFLDPKKALVNLKEKATAAEIGGAAIGQGLSATATSAEDLARFGINREQAQVGYSTIAEELPTAGSLGRIYGESGITYNQADAESATFKGLASAKRKKEQLKQLEEGQFSGSAGTSLGAGALSTQYLRKGSSSGQF
jgi:hypothetical protein